MSDYTNHRTRLGPFVFEAVRLLWELKEREGLGMNEMERRAELPTGQMARYMYGDLQPRIAAAIRIQEALGIPLTSWRAPLKKPFTVPAARKREGVRAKAGAKSRKTAA